MAGNPARGLERLSGIEAVVAAYAGTRAGHAAFERALTALRRALRGARLWRLVPADALPDGAGGDGLIVYPTPGFAAAAARTAALRTVDALAACGAQAALVFAERGFAPYVPAYLCYLAGIGYRAGIEQEFGGAVLSPAVRIPPQLDGVERHLALLAAAGLAPEPDRDLAAPPPASTNEGYGCDR